MVPAVALAMNPLALVESPVAVAPARSALGSGNYHASGNPLSPFDQV